MLALSYVFGEEGAIVLGRFLAGGLALLALHLFDKGICDRTVVEEKPGRISLKEREDMAAALPLGAAPHTSLHTKHDHTGGHTSVPPRVPA